MKRRENKRMGFTGLVSGVGSWMLAASKRIRMSAAANISGNTIDATSPTYKISRLTSALATLVALLALTLPALAQEPLSHDMLDPEPHLPGLPWWIPTIAVFLVVLSIAGIIAIIVFLTKQKFTPNTLRGPLQLAREHLLRLKDEANSMPLPQLATELSLTLRRYLADTKSDRSLFETREEFLANQKRLNALPEEVRAELTSHLLTLSEYQYAPPQEFPEKATELIDQSLACLEKASRDFSPAPTHV